MKILSVNAGSSSLKFQMYEMPSEEVLISGTFERISLENSFYTIKINGEKIEKKADLPNHEVAVQILIKELLDNCDLEELNFISELNKKDKNRVIKVIKNYVKDNEKEIKKQKQSLDDLKKLLTEEE